MKKLLILFVVMFTLTLVGCDFFSQGTTTTIINDEITSVLNTAQDTVEINSEWTNAGAKLVLNDTEYNMVTTDVVDNALLGLYEITYSYEYNSEIYSITRYVMVIDQTSPAMQLNLGVDTVKVGETWIDGGVTVTDNSLENITATISGTVVINTAGTYEITYTATDSSGNTSSIIRYITVIE